MAVDVTAPSVRPALHAVDHEVAEQLLIGQLVVGADIEYVHVALAARPAITWTFAGADDVELLVVGREHEPVGIRNLVLAHYEVDASAPSPPLPIPVPFPPPAHAP